MEETSYEDICCFHVYMDLFLGRLGIPTPLLTCFVALYTDMFNTVPRESSFAKIYEHVLYVLQGNRKAFKAVSVRVVGPHDVLGLFTGAGSPM